MYFDQERSRANASAALVSMTLGKGKRQKRPPAQFTELGPFVGPNEPKSSDEKLQTKANESGPKTFNRVSNVVLLFPWAQFQKKAKCLNRKPQQPDIGTRPYRRGPKYADARPHRLGPDQEKGPQDGFKRYPENHLGPIQIAQ